MVSPSLVSGESGENSAPDRGGKGSERAAEAVGQGVCIDVLALDRLGVLLEAVARLSQCWVLLKRHSIH